LRQRAPRDLDGEPCLADATHPGQGHEAMAGEKAAYRRDILVSTDQIRCGRREVRLCLWQARNVGGRFPRRRCAAAGADRPKLTLELISAADHGQDDFMPRERLPQGLDLRV
jgi:hypothetical protein